MQRVEFHIGNRPQNRIRFYALTRILGVSANTIYLWRAGTDKSPALAVEVERVKNKNVVWVSVAVLENWLKEYRPKLVKNLNRFLARTAGVRTHAQDQVAA
jgi:hypothetical protein